MKPRSEVIERLRQCAEEARSTADVTDEDRREYRILDARQRARDDARRAAPSPQLELPEAA